MAQQRSLKNFYLFLGAVVVIGGGAIVWMTQGSTAPVVLPTANVPVGVDTAPPPAYAMGSDTAPLVIDEWSDFECPYCSQLAVLILPDIKRRYVDAGLVQWRFNDFPLDMHPNAPTAHLAAACAARQGAFWPMHDLIYFNQGEWAGGSRARGHMADYAQQAGVDVGQWNACMGDQEPLTRIAQTVQRGQARGVGGTPTFFFNGQRVDFNRLSYDRLVAEIDRRLGDRAPTR